MIYLIQVNQAKEEGCSLLLIKHGGKKSEVHNMAQAEYRKAGKLKSSVALHSKTLQTFEDNQEELARQILNDLAGRGVINEIC